MEMTAADLAAHVRKEFAKVIVGQDEVVEQLLLVVLARGHAVDRGRARTRKNARREISGAHFPSAVSARAVYARSDSGRCPGRKYLRSRRVQFQPSPRTNLHGFAAGR